jgi:hypothetical protein
MLTFLEIVKTILLLLITVFTAYIAHQLYQANKDKSKASLREKRLGVYNEVIRILTLITRDGDISSEELLSFRSKTHESNFLFEKDIADYINEIYARGLKLRSTNSLMKSAALPIGEDRDNITVENSKQLIWLADQLPYVKKKFEKYLSLDVSSVA